MNTTFLYTFPQWFVFAAMFVVIYGWVEDKKTFRLIGITIFILLALFSVYVIKGDFLAAGKYPTPEEIVGEELGEEVISDVPIEAKLLPAYLSFIFAGILAIPAIILDWKEKKYAKLFIILTGLVALMGFFIIVGAIRSV